MKKELESIERNQRVEADKAWETSKTRRSVIAIVTYLIALWFMWSIDLAHPWLNALIPTGGYVLSTLSLSFIKKHRIQKVYNK